MSIKLCYKCGEEKPTTEFTKNKTKKDGLNMECTLCKKAYFKEYMIKNKTRLKENKKKWYQDNIERERNRSREYQRENKEVTGAKHKKYLKERAKTDPVFKLGNTIRNAITSALKKKNFTKKSRTYKILGCTYKEFKTHLENNPYGFTIEDNDMDIDHIVPISSATTEEEVLILSYHTNFQLLPKDYNRNIKKDNPWNPQEFENWLQENPL